MYWAGNFESKERRLSVANELPRSCLFSKFIWPAIFNPVYVSRPDANTPWVVEDGRGREKFVAVVR